MVHWVYSCLMALSNKRHLYHYGIPPLPLTIMHIISASKERIVKRLLDRFAVIDATVYDALFLISPERKQ